jgi:polysaccharide pyruvyl transferase WcaK-like protein
VSDIAIVTALPKGGAAELAAALRSVALEHAAGQPPIIVLHTGLRPRAVEELVLAYPAVDFVLGDASFSDSFARSEGTSWAAEAQQLEALNVGAHARIAFLPPELLSAEAVSLVLAAEAPAAGNGAAGDSVARIWESAGVPGDFFDQFALQAETRRDRRPWEIAEAILRRSGGAVGRVQLPAAPQSPTTEQLVERLRQLPDAPPELIAFYSAQLEGDTTLPPAGNPRNAFRDARELAKSGKVDEARTIALAALRASEQLPVDGILALASAFRAASRYTLARNTLVLARQGTAGTTAALAEEADIAWIEHDYGRARELAIASLRADLSNRKAETIRGRAELPYTRAEDLPGRSAEPGAEPRPTFAHVAFYVSAKGNFGDVSLPVTVREAVSTVSGPSNWLSVHAHQFFDEERLELVNQTDGIIIGGGGLFLPDTATNSNSGWQWNIHRRMLDRITVPIGVMTVGYNLFPGQSFHGDLFTSSVVRLVERSSVFGLRNRGSVARVQELLPADLTDRVTFMPCTTTVLNHVRSFDTPPRSGTGIVLINAAFDRSERRFGEKYDVFLTQMAQYVRDLRSAGVDVRFASHLPADERLTDDLASTHDIRMPVHALYDMTLEEGYELYRSVSLVVGMRGHATMIPFGLGTPVLSLISHPKMRYFLEDIGRTEWGFDIFEKDLAVRMGERTRDILDNEPRYRADIERLQLDLLEPVRETVERFHGASI